MQDNVTNYLTSFSFNSGLNLDFFKDDHNKTKIEEFNLNENKYPKFINEFWTAKQRQALSLHEISYRACFKPQLPRFFIELLSKENDFIYDPFSGRGTTALEAALLGRNIIANDINPLSRILTEGRFFIPKLEDVKLRLENIPLTKNAKAEIDLSMFYHHDTEAEIVSLKNYLIERKNKDSEDNLDRWIRMLATNRLTGHSKGFFSVYTLPPNQAVSQERQIKINQKLNQIPEYKDIRKIILHKTKQLIADISINQKNVLLEKAKNAYFLNKDARETTEIPDSLVQLTVTSPPFLDVVQYNMDNWLRCWFNNLDADKIAEQITMTRKLEQWTNVMDSVFAELYRITKSGGWVAFEVGEVKKGKIKLDEHVLPLGIKNGFSCQGILINEQQFTKTSNIWGVNNNQRGTNSNRIVMFQK